ncbi:Cyclin [Rhodotorula toruloides ATCC 204091]|uniref:BY PROTMAP: gi/814541099/emb/CEQ41539.1/ SPOSA6832_03267 [Sporidiobolus salmonicolor] n=1 Tax=Rhodotorula toruloides TaxID=5286 RepID=A0A0K3C7G0_RHOTO|nr:Cyclin [Rhodotorula toruloides ATCC 204091]KAK4335650.1 G2/mitotic-specific cyclin-4 [Rhodotorula toruloides]PRQ77581.1 cyclin [Rhodotorula toruloides]
MKVPTAASLPAARATVYPRKRSPGIADQRGPSPPSKRTSPTSVEMQRHAQLSDAQKQLLPLLERDYREDVRAYMYEMQSKTMANADMIDQQPELEWYMRAYLVDFLVEIHLQHRLRPETLYLALNIVDRYVSKRIVFKKHYQLVGCAALWIAAKFEDAKDRVPTLRELVDMCCNAYDEKAFVQMEGHVLSTIQWVIGHPTAEAWLRLACVTGQLEDARTQHVARFLMELTLFHREFILFYPCDVAMAALLLARYMLGKPRRSQDESEPVIRIMLMLDELLGEHLEDVSPVVLKKYSFSCYSRASIFAREWYLCGRRMAFPHQQAATTPVTPSRPLARTASSASAASSSSSASSIVDYGSLTPNSQRSEDTSFTSDEDDDDEIDRDCLDDDDDDDEPLSPHTPHEPSSPFDPFTSAASDAASAAAHHAAVAAHSVRMGAGTGKENLLVARQGKPSGVVVGQPQAMPPSHRMPLEHASWEMNHQHVASYASHHSYHGAHHLPPPSSSVASSPSIPSYCA